MVQSRGFKNVYEVIGNENTDLPQQSRSKHLPNTRPYIARSVLLSLLHDQLIELFTDVLLDSTNNFKKYPHLYPVVTTSDSRAIKIIKSVNFVVNHTT